MCSIFAFNAKTAALSFPTAVFSEFLARASPWHVFDQKGQNYSLHPSQLLSWVLFAFLPSGWSPFKNSFSVCKSILIKKQSVKKMLIDFLASVAFVFSNILTAVLQFAFLDGNLMPPPPLLPPIISWTTLDFSCPVADMRMTLPASDT